MVTIRCSVVDAGRCAAPVDLDVTAPAAAPWGLVAPDVAAALGWPSDVRWTCAGDALLPEQSLGHPPLVTGALLVVGQQESAQVPRGLLELHVVAGPDCGAVHRLRPGRHGVGRSANATVSLADPDVSRAHLSLVVTADGLFVEADDSVNGTTVDGLVVGQDERHAVRPGQRVGAGRTTLVVRSPVVRTASTRVTETGTVEVNRAPRPRPARPPVELRRPTRTDPPSRAGLPLVAMLVPLAVAIPVVLITRQLMFLLFALMTPVMVLGNALSDRMRGRRERREAGRRFADEGASFEGELTAALADDLAAARSQHPDAAELLRCVTRPTARLWERAAGNPDVLDLLLGTGSVPSRVSVRDEHAAAPRTIADAPVTVSLPAVGHLGVAGPRTDTLAVARHLICQVGAWHSPRTVSLVLLTADTTSEPDWLWARWLPHLSGAGVVADREAAKNVVAHLLDRLSSPDSGRGTWPGPVTVVVIDRASSLRSLPGLAQLLAVGPSIGVHAICLDDDPSGLAGECGALLDLTGDDAVLLADDLVVDPVHRDAVSTGWAEQVARSLAGLSDATPATATASLPREVALRDLLGVDPTDPEQVVAAWNRCPRTTSATIGVAADGPFTLDLRRDGPHVLVAGTTGAGKSELLQTLVAALAVANRPDELSFVLIDYKGGAAFGGCVDLPHTSGLVTDLDEHLAERALVSLGAELTRRERLLKAMGCSDIDAFEHDRDHDPQLPPLARLVVVIDEFRLLAEELPAFVAGLVRVAAVGRSLGVHVVLATQRPAGIVSADIKANVNARIALRVRDRADSDDVVDAPDAARIDAATPGRAVFRTGSQAVREVQIARVGGMTSLVDPDRVRVRRVGDPAPEQPGGDDLAAIVSGLRAAMALAGVGPAPAAWLPPLPAHLGRPPAGAAGALGLVDLPAQLRQPALCWRGVDDGHLGICGGPRSGRTSALISIALALTECRSPDDLSLHVIDAASGQLTALNALPHSGTILGRDEPALISRFVRLLTAEVRRRLDHRTSDPPMVLLVDGWDSLVEALDGLDHGRTTDALIALLRDGRAAGLAAVVAGHRSLLTSRVTSVLAERWLLRVTDPTDLLLAGVSPAALGPDAPPGRGVRTSDGATLQLASPGDIGPAAAAHQRWPPARTRVLRVAELPQSVDLEVLTQQTPAALGLLLGVGGDEPRPVRLDLDRHRVFVIAGPGGSGRSTALRTIARGLHGTTSLVAICPRSSGLDAGPWPVLGARDDAALARVLDADPTTHVLVDDVELIADSAIDHLLDDLARLRGPLRLVLAGTTAALAASFRGCAATARAARTGLLLAPTSGSDGEPLGVRAEPGGRTAPGRGLLVLAGVQQPLQVAR